MQPLLVLPVLAFLILLALFLLVMRRAGRFVAATRDVERFRRQVGDLGGRAETSLAEICGRIDAVRRGQLGADQIAEDVTASLDAVGRYADEARGLHPPADGRAIREENESAFERAHRALERVEHGRAIQASARSGGREIEAQTAIKRGYLNVLHAREAIAHQAKLASDLSATAETSRFQRRSA
jgi:hypothetical protein